MNRPAAALLLALAVQGGAVAGAQTPAPPAEPTMMIVEFPQGARFIGFPQRCPDSTGEDPDEDAICTAELYEGPAIVIHHLSGPRVARRARLRLTAHARRWTAGTRMLVVTRPFDDRGTRGNFAAWWHLPEDDDSYCIAAEELAGSEDGIVPRRFALGYRRLFRARGFVEAAEVRCIRG